MIESEARRELTLVESVGSPVSAIIDRPIGLPLGIPLFAALTAVGAYVAVPMAPVPMTLQTLFVLLAGTVLGPAAGAASQLLYIAVGAAGAPIFSGGGAGLGWVFGPTGGFLMAFPLAAAMAGWLAGEARRVIPTVLGLIVGTVAIFLLGAAWLGATTDWDGTRIAQVAVLPFLFGAVVKAAIALVVTRQVISRGAGR